MFSLLLKDLISDFIFDKGKKKKKKKKKKTKMEIKVEKAMITDCKCNPWGSE